MSVVGTNIKNARTKKNMSLKEVAKKCGVSELFLSDIESGKRVPNTQVISSISKVLGIQIDAIEPSYFSDYFSSDPQETKPAEPARPERHVVYKAEERSQPVANTLSDAFSKAVRKIPVLNKITAGKKVPYEMDIVDSKFEPVFQTKGNNVAGEAFIYFIVQDNSMSGTRILKNDLALVFLTDSYFDKDILLIVHQNRTYIRRCKNIEDKRVLLYPENPDYDALILEKKDIQVVGKLVRVEFKL